DNTCLSPTTIVSDVYSVTHTSFTNNSAFESGKTYTVSIVAKDRAGNSATITKNFTWDTTPPEAGIVQPAVAKSTFNALTAITGTATDFGFQVYATSFSLQSLGNGKCFNEITGVFNKTCPYWINTSSDPSANWIYTDANINTRMTETNTYYVLLTR